MACDMTFAEGQLACAFVVALGQVLAVWGTAAGALLLPLVCSSDLVVWRTNTSCCESYDKKLTYCTVQL